MATVTRTLRAIGMALGTVLMLGQASASFGDSIPTSCDMESGISAGICASSTPGGIQAGIWLAKNDQASSQQGGGTSTVDTQRNQLTAEGAAAPEAERYWNWARCASVSIGTAPNDGHVSDEDCSLPFDPVTGTVTRDPAQLPTTRDLLLAAATIIHADGAGLLKQPEGVSYTNKYIPTLVAATHPTQAHTVTLLGHDITVTLTATSYTWSWGDGTPDLTTTSPGMPWQEGMDPNTDPALIRHYYKAPNGWKSFLDGPYPSATRTITLTTTWAGTATNPFTGDTQTINGLVTTTETTGPFPLGQLIVNNTDTSEEKQGH